MAKRLIIIFLVAFIYSGAIGQRTIVSGTVYDISKKIPIEAVSVISTSGQGTTTDSAGRYTITVNETDSIYFSFLNRPTPKYPVTAIVNLSAFDISILMKTGDLPIVTVKQRSYRMDSLQNRMDYAKIFNYERPGIKTSVGDMTVGMDISEFIKMFQFGKNRRMAAFKKRLLKEEEDRYINHRFSKALVKKLTSLQPPQLDSFMVEFKPTVDMVDQMNDLELGQFILEAFKYYKAGIRIDRSTFQRYGLLPDEE